MVLALSITSKTGFFKSESVVKIVFICSNCVKLFGKLIFKESANEIIASFIPVSATTQIKCA